MDGADAILRDALLTYGPAEAVIQLLAGSPNIPRSRAESVLRFQGFGNGLADREVGSLLMVMHRAELIRYAKRLGTFEILVNPAQEPVPPESVFIAPETPFANRVWLRRILEECDGFIYWLDKHFMPGALEVIWEAAAGSRVSEVRVLSLKLPDNSGKNATRDYRNLRSELESRSVAFEWRVIDSKLIRDTHDRWIIGRSSARNVPNVNAILSGQRSELHRSDHADELRTVFEDYWAEATPIDNS